MFVVSVRALQQLVLRSLAAGRIAAFPLVLGLLAAGCLEPELTSATQLTVRLYASSRALVPAARLQLRVAAEQAGRWSQREPRSFALSELPAWPVDVTVVPAASSDRDALFEVIVELLDPAGVVLLQQRALTRFVPQQQRVLELWLSPCGARPLGQLCESNPGCFGTLCQSCVEGSCRATPVLEGDQLPLLDPRAEPEPNLASSVPGAIDEPVVAPPDPAGRPAGPPSVVPDGTSCSDPDHERVQGVCTPRDDCRGVSTCAPGHCVDSTRSYYCQCPLGYTGTGTDRCNEVDECKSDHPCDASPLACVDDVASTTCVCPATHRGDGLGAQGCTHRVASLLPADVTCAALATGAIKCWPLGNDGKIGDALLPLRFGAGHTARALASGWGNNVCALLDDASVRCWGDNVFGQLGVGDTEPHPLSPETAIDTLPAIALGTGVGVAALTAGGDHFCALLSDGRVKCWGSNVNGELGLGDTRTRGDTQDGMGDALPAVDLGRGVKATAIDAEGNVSCALLEGGSIKCWGSNLTGALGQGDIKRRGALPADMGDALAAVSLGIGRKALSMSVASDHVCALLDDHSIKCWGSNTFGDLGLGDTVTRGDLPNQMGDALPAVQLGERGAPLERIKVSEVLARHWGGCALLDDGSVKCWGDNEVGHLGLGDKRDRGDEPNEMGNQLPAISLGTGRRVLALRGKGRAACALLDDQTVKCWGANATGTLGYGPGDHATRGDELREMGDALPAVDLGGD